MIGISKASGRKTKGQAKIPIIALQELSLHIEARKQGRERKAFLEREGGGRNKNSEKAEDLPLVFSPW